MVFGFSLDMICGLLCWPMMGESIKFEQNPAVHGWIVAIHLFDLSPFLFLSGPFSHILLGDDLPKLRQSWTGRKPIIGALTVSFRFTIMLLRSETKERPVLLVIKTRVSITQNCPWVGSTHGFVWVVWVDIFSFLVGWVADRKNF